MERMRWLDRPGPHGIVRSNLVPKKIAGVNLLQNRNNGRELNYSPCLLFIAYQVVCLFRAPDCNLTDLVLSVFPRGHHFLSYVNCNQWHPVLRTLKNQIEENTGHTFNSLLCNLYRNEKDRVDWHSDDEPSLGSCPIIASLSLGATRTFEMRKKPPPVSILFANMFIFFLPPVTL